MTLLAMLNKVTHFQFEHSPGSDCFGFQSIVPSNLMFLFVCAIQMNINFHSASRVGVLVRDKIYQFIIISLEFAV